MNKTKILVPFEVIPDNDVPIVKFYLDKNPCYAIIDTGAESTIFDKSIRDLLTISDKQEIGIVGVSGETESAMIEIANANIWVHNSQKHVGMLRVNGYVNDISHLSAHFLPNGGKKISAIFGSDMLDKFNADVNFIRREVTFSL